MAILALAESTEESSVLLTATPWRDVFERGPSNDDCDRQSGKLEYPGLVGEFSHRSKAPRLGRSK